MHWYCKFPKSKQVVSIGTLAIVLFAGLFSLVIYRQKGSASCETTDAAQRPIVNSTIPVHPLWSRAIEIDNNPPPNTFLVSTPSLLIGAHYCPDPWIHKVSAFAWQTGQVLWTSDVGPDISDLVLDAHRDAIYLEETGQIQALAAKDGTLQWTNQTSLYSHTGHPL